MLAITNAIIVMTDHYIYDGTVLVDNGRIVDFGRKVQIPEGAEILDAKGAYVGPGLIDVHTHSDGDIFFTEDPEKAANTLLMHGVTDVMPALYYNMNADQYVKAIEVLKKAMAEGKVTVDGKTYKLPEPFMVIATQNPVEFVGTYPLPEAQLDRFMMKLTIGYPDREKEIQMASKYLQGETSDTVTSVCDAETVLSLQEKVRQVRVSDGVLGYVEDIIRLTREEERFVLGASPRAMLALLRASQARAFLQERDYVKPDDVKQMAEAVLLHRLVLSNDARIRKENAGKILQSLVLKAKLPV